MDTIGLHVLCVDAVIAYMRIRERDNLLAVTGISQNFLITRHGGIENDFANGRALGAYRLANVYGSVCERQNGVWGNSLEGQKHWDLRVGYGYAQAHLRMGILDLLL